jgi:hypothetical protein
MAEACLAATAHHSGGDDNTAILILARDDIEKD